MSLKLLQELKDSGEFHHATYRNFGTLWEGLWVYKNDPQGFRGYSPALSFMKDDPSLKAAENMVLGTGVSLGSYGNG